MYAYDRTRKVVVDERGLPISITEAKQWLAALRAHIKQGPAGVAGQCYSIVSKQYPGMIDQIDCSPERFE